MNLTLKRLLPVLLLAGSAGATAPRHRTPRSKTGNLVVGLCDGKTSLEVPGVREGETMTRTQAQAVSDELMATWRQKNPDARWEEPVQLAQKDTPKPSTAPASASSGAAAGKQAPGSQQAGAPAAQEKQQTGHTYGAFSERDEKIWKASTEAFITEGHRVFHDAKAIGGTIAVSCDMCHPDASNTHPETYPKFQVQLGRVALLRDMINWCIQNPVRGKPLKDDDPRLKAMEAYIYSKRKGVPLEYGKH